MSPTIIGSFSLVILQNFFKFESSQNQGKFLGSQKSISVQISDKSVQGGFIWKIKSRTCMVIREIRACNKVCQNRGKHHISAYFSKDQLLILQKK